MGVGSPGRKLRCRRSEVGGAASGCPGGRRNRGGSCCCRRGKRSCDGLAGRCCCRCRSPARACSTTRTFPVLAAFRTPVRSLLTASLASASCCRCRSQQLLSGISHIVTCERERSHIVCAHPKDGASMRAQFSRACGLDRTVWKRRCCGASWWIRRRSMRVHAGMGQFGEWSRAAAWVCTNTLNTSEGSRVASPPRWGRRKS
jgi:hypothetical protein